MISIQDIQQLSNQITQHFQPDKIILFGSHAYGKPRPDSDVDLLVLLAFNGNSFHKSLEILQTVKPQFAVDLIVRNPADAVKRQQMGDPVMREALTHGKILYERHH